MRRYTVYSYFVIDAESEDDAKQLACSMQEAANDVGIMHGRRLGKEAILLIDENKPVAEDPIPE